MADYYSAASTLEFDSGEGTDQNLDASDTDSAYGEDSFSRRTQSVTSSVYQYRHEHGRRYHAYQDGVYVVPNDEDEQDRLDLQHHLFRLTLDGALCIAPISENIQNVLDVGTGTGIWAMDFADEHPGAQVLGVDLSPIQPTDVPPNCSFRIDDIEQEWLDAEESYDLIHSRAMVLAFKNWPGFIKQAFDHLKPGGILELQDLCFPAVVDDPESSENSMIVKWLRLIIVAGNKVGADPEAPVKWAQMLRDAGFVDINIKWHNWPIGPWAKQRKNKNLGRWCHADMENAVGASVGLMTRALGWKLEEVQVFHAQVRKEMREQKVHSYFPVAFCWARKPYVNSFSSNVPDTNSVPTSEGPSPGPDTEETNNKKEGSVAPSTKGLDPVFSEDSVVEAPAEEPVYESVDIPHASAKPDKAQRSSSAAAVADAPSTE